MTLSNVVEMLLTRPEREAAPSYVSLTRGASGETTIDVRVMASEGRTLAEAEDTAIAIYDRLAQRYLCSNGDEGASTVDLDRNAKGITQIGVSSRKSGSPAEVADEARETYDSLRGYYPLPDGFVGA